MHHRCDQCDQSATCHQVEIKNGEKTVRHLCDQHAAEAGLGAAGVSSELLALLGQVVAEVLPKAAIASVQISPSGKGLAGPELCCPGCGQSLRDFQTTRLLGCPECYETFEAVLATLLEQQHGATHHVGKIPVKTAHSRNLAHQQAILMRMRRKLEQAVTREDFRLAARLRDEIKEMETEGASVASSGDEAALGDEVTP